VSSIDDEESGRLLEKTELPVRSKKKAASKIREHPIMNDIVNLRYRNPERYLRIRVRICRTVAATSQILFKQCLSKALAKHTQIHPRDTPEEKERKSTRRPWKGSLQTFMYDGKLPPVRCFPLVRELLGREVQTTVEE
jgi:hypothetical protein